MLYNQGKSPEIFSLTRKLKIRLARAALAWASSVIDGTGPFNVSTYGNLLRWPSTVLCYNIANKATECAPLIVSSYNSGEHCILPRIVIRFRQRV